MTPASAPYAIAAFYKFAAIENPGELKDRLTALCCSHAIIGTILIAPEGINGTIAGGHDQLEAFLARLLADERFIDLDIKRSVASAKPFQRLKVKLKREIVTFGVPEADPNQRAGIYVEPHAWNELIARPGVVLVDTRNAYEVAVGTFPGALDPQTRAFGEFPRYVESNRKRFEGKKIAMFCTGGIRCEKATAYMRSLGFEDVYHLKGGILRYLETIPPDQSRWQGECYVFDERVAVADGVREGTHSACPTCGRPLAKGTACGVCG